MLSSGAHSPAAARPLCAPHWAPQSGGWSGMRLPKTCFWPRSVARPASCSLPPDWISSAVTRRSTFHVSPRSISISTCSVFSSSHVCREPSIRSAARTPAPVGGSSLSPAEQYPHRGHPAEPSPPHLADRASGLRMYRAIACNGSFLEEPALSALPGQRFETEHVAVGEVGLSPKLYDANQTRIAFSDAVLGNLRAIPGVESAGLVSTMPLEGERWIEFVGRVDRPNQEGPLINLRWVSQGYFETTRQRIIAGRFFEERDRNLNSVVLSEGEAKALWGSDDPIGGQVKIRGRTCTVIGVVADSRNTSLKSTPAKMAYLHYKDQP